MPTTHTTWEFLGPGVLVINSSAGLRARLKAVNRFEPVHIYDTDLTIGVTPLPARDFLVPVPGVYPMYVHPRCFFHTEELQVTILYDGADLTNSGPILVPVNPEPPKKGYGVYEYSIWILIFISTLATIIAVWLYWYREFGPERNIGRAERIYLREKADKAPARTFRSSETLPES
jgi:hypothetical protein